MSVVDASRTSRRSLRVQIGSLGVARVTAAALSAVWLVVAARNLSLAAYGDFTQVVSLSVILTAAADLGLSMLLAHDVARWPGASRSFLVRVVALRLVIGVGACLLMAALYWLAATDPTLVVAGLAALSMLATMVHQSICVAARGLGDVRPEAVNEMASRGFVLAAGFGALAIGGSVAAAVAVYAVADLLSAVLLWRRVVPSMPAGAPQQTFGFPLRRFALLGLTVATMTIYTRADIWLLGVLEGSATVARYAAPYRLFEGVLIVASAFAALVPPTIARVRWTDTVRALNRLACGAVAATAALAVIGIVAASPLLEMLFGARYAGTAPVLRILLVGAVPSAIVVVLVQGAGLLDRRGTAIAVALALVGNVVGNLAVIPRWGIEGAAAMTTATQVGLAVALVIVVRRAGARPRAPEASLKAEALEFSSEVAAPLMVADA